MSKKRKQKTPAKKNPAKSSGKAPSNSEATESAKATPDHEANQPESPVETDAAPTRGLMTESVVNLNPAESAFVRYFSFAMLLGVIVLVLILFYEVMVGFFVPLFLALILVVIFRPLHKWLLPRCGERKNVAALLTTAIVMLSVLIPLGILIVLAVIEGQEVASQFNVARLTQGAVQIRTRMNLEMPTEYASIEYEIERLQSNATLSITTEDIHRTALFEAESAAKELAKSNELPWPSAASSSDDSESVNTSVDAWSKFSQSIVDLRALHRTMQWSPLAESDAYQKQMDQLHDYQVLLADAATSFKQFKTDQLGGKSRAWLVSMVNPTPEQTEKYSASMVSFLREQLLAIGGKGVSYLGGLGLSLLIMVIAFYFFLIDGPAMLETFKGLSPIDDEHEQELASEFARVSRAVVLATLLAALVQGLLAGIGFYFAGLESIFLLTVLSAVLAMVPFFGAASVWVPCAIYLYVVDNNLTAAIGLAIYGAAVISMADNFIKPMVLHGQSNIHPLLAFLSIIGGVTTLGPIGILIGPMIVAFLQTLLKILRQEMMDLGQLAEQQLATGTATES
ncbi:MAG: AI-2E family transporter [Planctomycetota bacterium]